MCDVSMLGIVLSWNMATSVRHAEASTYHLYAYQEGTDPPSTNLWKRVSRLYRMLLVFFCFCPVTVFIDLLWTG